MIPIIFGRSIWYRDLFGRPLNYFLCVITVVHELTLPQRAVDDPSWISFVLAVVTWLIFPFVGRHK